MANPAKRKVGTDPDSAPPPSAPVSKPDKVVPPKAKTKVRAQQATPARHTPATVPDRQHRPSPKWVPVAMFGLWILGLLLIILNYMEVLPGSANGGDGWYLVAGLMSILAGIMAATQYR